MRKSVALALLCSSALSRSSFAGDLAPPPLSEADIGKHFEMVVIYDKTIHNPADGYDVIFHLDRGAAREPPRTVGCRVPRLDPLRVERMDFVSRRAILWTQVVGTISDVTPAGPPRLPGGRPEAGTVWLKNCRFDVVNWSSR